MEEKEQEQKSLLQTQGRETAKQNKTQKGKMQYVY